MKNKTIKSKIHIVFGLSALITLILLSVPSQPKVDVSLPVVTVYKSPTCGCCKKWVKHLQNSGFKVISKNRNSLDSIKEELGIPSDLKSCHTAKVGDYAVEDHVPASDIKQMLAEKPEIGGLGVPGMPMGSSGIEGSRKDNYKVFAFIKGKPTTVFSNH